MKKTAFVLVWMLAGCVFGGCAGERQPPAAPESDPAENAVSAPFSQADADSDAPARRAMDAYLDELLRDSYMQKEMEPYLKEFLYAWNGEVVYCGGGFPAYFPQTKNLHIFEEWLERYMNGQPGTVALLQEGSFTQDYFLYFIESDGTALYSVSRYWIINDYTRPDDGSEGWVATQSEGEEHWQSAGIWNRTLDYVISPERENPYLLFKVGYSAEPLEWEEGMVLGEITPQEAEAISRGLGSKGVLLRDRTPDDARGDGAGRTVLEELPIFNLVVGAERIRGLDCYVLDGFVKKDGEIVFSGGSTEAICADGSVYFQYDQADGGWYLAGDNAAERMLPVTVWDGD